MPRWSHHVPSYRLHRATGQAIVTIDGQDHYLGKYDSAESRQRYDELVGAWLLKRPAGPAGQSPAGPAGRARPAEAITVRQLAARYLEYVHGPESPYWKAGRLTNQVDRVRRALAPVLQQYGDRPAAEFTPQALKAVRLWMMTEAPCHRCKGSGREPLLKAQVRWLGPARRREQEAQPRPACRLCQGTGTRGWSFNFTKHCINCIRQAFDWAAEEGLLSGSVAHALRAVKNRRKAMRPARRPAKIRPVPREVFLATRAKLHPILADLATVQYLGAMRPKEAVALQPRSVIRSGPDGWCRLPDGRRYKGVWAYLVPDWANKTAHHDRERIVFLGPQAQAALAPYLERGPEEFCFCPREVVAQLQQTWGRPLGFGRGRAPGPRYTTESYDNVIEKAARRAGQPHWSPNQLRKLRATEVQARFGSDVARCVLGHALPGVTGVYAQADLKKAARAQRLSG